MASSSRRTRMKMAINQPRYVLILTPEQRQRYSEFFENRKVIVSKYLDWSFFESCDDLPVLSLLENLGLRKMVSWKGSWSQEIVRTFYTTLKYSIREKSISAEVRGVKIVVTEDRLAEILEIPPPTEDCIYFTENYNSLSPDFYDKEEVYKTITRQVAFTDQEIRVIHMDATDRLLLSVIANIIFNKAGNLANGSESEFLAMYCILQRIPFNVPYLIMRRMEACARRKSPLPYAAFISKILKAFNISPHFNHDEKSQIIDRNSMRRMNFIIIDNTWRRARENLTIKRARERKEAEEEESTDSEEGGEEDSADHVASQPSSSHNSDVLLQQILENQRNQQTLLENLDERLSHQAREISDLKELMHELLRKQGQE